MALHQPLFQENDITDQHAIQMRTYIRDVFGGRSGVMASQTMLVTQRGAGANMSVDVTTGSALVPGSAVTNQGFYYVFNDATVNVPINASDPSNPRHTLIIVRVRDSFYSGSDNDAQLLAVDGTPNASPADPDLVALGYTNYLVLGRVVVGAGVTSILTANITNLAVWTTPIGTTIFCTSATRPASPWTGMTIFETDTSRYRAWDGTAWQYLPWGIGTNPNMVEIQRSSGQTCAVNAVVTIDFDAVVSDVSSMASLAANSITVNRTGRWEVGGEYRIAAPTGDLGLRPLLYVNGAHVREGPTARADLLTDGAGQATWNLRLTSGDVLTYRTFISLFGSTNQTVSAAFFYARWMDTN